MPLSPRLQARIDEIIRRGPHNRHGHPAWFTAEHNQFLENAIDFRNGSLLPFFQADKMITGAARAAIQLALERMAPPEYNDDEEFDRERALGRTQRPPAYSPPRAPSRPRSVRRSQTPAPVARERSRPRPLRLEGDLEEDMDWGADLTNDLEAVDGDPFRSSRSRRGRNAAQRSPPREAREAEAGPSQPSARMSQQSAIKRKPVGSGPKGDAERTQGGRVQRPSQRSPERRSTRLNRKRS